MPGTAIISETPLHYLRCRHLLAGPRCLVANRAGRCVQTSLAKATALVSERDDGSFDLVIRRSFADYLARWLLDAGAEFGVQLT